ncbi:hypothetical protein VTN77DRAFT_8362 [Rasamsonia byssochlamydoides]|uniref:uncharacterized protein n=1 Tax=Rasamsonia byssochlamydoides TaxID=89139 RepID=UPI0037444F61
MVLSLELSISIVALIVAIFGVVSQVCSNYLAGGLQKTMDEGTKSLRDIVALLKELNKLNKKHRERLEGFFYYPGSSSSKSKSSSESPSFFNPSAAFQV